MLVVTPGPVFRRTLGAGLRVMTRVVARPVTVVMVVMVAGRVNVAGLVGQGRVRVRQGRQGVERALDVA